MNRPNPFTKQPTQELSTPVLVFLGEQDGSAERSDARQDVSARPKRALEWRERTIRICRRKQEAYSRSLLLMARKQIAFDSCFKASPKVRRCPVYEATYTAAAGTHGQASRPRSDTRTVPSTAFHTAAAQERCTSIILCVASNT